MTAISADRVRDLIAQSWRHELYSKRSTTISGFDPSRNGGPQVPAPLDVKTCIFPIRLKP
jgi:hypothetical protein